MRVLARMCVCVCVIIIVILQGHIVSVLVHTCVRASEESSSPIQDVTHRRRKKKKNSSQPLDVLSQCVRLCSRNKKKKKKKETVHDDVLYRF